MKILNNQEDLNNQKEGLETAGVQPGSNELVTRVIYSSESNRKRTVGITLPRSLVKQARKHGLNISRVSEEALKVAIADLKRFSLSSGSLLPKEKVIWWAGPDLNRRPSACQADVLTVLDDRPLSSS